MATHIESVKVSNPSYASGKQLAQHIFLEAMATIDLRHAMLAKLKREGGALVAGGRFDSALAAAARRGVWQSGKPDGRDFG